jgi:hypothetical protein
MFTFNQKVQQVAVCTQQRHWFELEGNTILELVMACDKMWVHYLTPESKLSSTEWRHKWSPTSKKFKTHLSAGKI